MKILHTADWHLGKRIEGRDRGLEQRAVLRDMARIASQEKVDIVVVAGDIYDGYNPSAEAEDLFFDSVEALSAGGERAVVVISGNHDDAKRLCASSELAKKHNIFISGGKLEKFAVPEQSEQDSETRVRLIRSVSGGLLFKKGEEELALSLIPYPSEARSGEADNGASYADKVRGWLNTELFSKKRATMIVSHIFMAGSEAVCGERSIEAGGLKAVGYELFEGAHYVALGHIHRMQMVKNARYSGSIMPYAFDETDDKGVTIVDLDKSGVHSIEFVKLSGYKQLASVCVENMEEVEQALFGLENSYVELTLRLNHPLSFVENKALRNAHPEIIVLKLEIRREELVLEEQRRNLTPEQLFAGLYQKKYGQLPSKELLQCFNELFTEVEQENE